MAKTLTIRHTIPISDEKWAGPYVTFYQWLPTGETEALVRETGDYTARLWIDRKCVASLSPVDDESLSRWVNITVQRVYVDVIVRGISDELAKFIHDERESPRGVHYGIGPEHEDYEQYSNRYLDLGLNVLELALKIYNRFIAYARNHKSQFWLPERPFDKTRLAVMNVAFEAKVRSKDHGWVRWCPPGTYAITIDTAGKETSIKKDDWVRLQEFVSGDSRPNIVLELLANAQLLIDEERRRSAIIEAASALEIAVSEFASSPKLDDLVAKDLLARLDSKSLHSQVKHLGFSGSIRYLLPLLFPADILPMDIIKSCQQVIEIRNNVVHNRQRDISPERIRLLVASVREACEILAKYTS
jgi:hypothetical protein